MHPKPYPTDGHPDTIDLKEAQSFGKEMAQLGLRIQTEGPGAVFKEQPDTDECIFWVSPNTRVLCSCDEFVGTINHAYGSTNLFAISSTDIKICWAMYALTKKMEGAETPSVCLQ